MGDLGHPRLPSGPGSAFAVGHPDPRPRTASIATRWYGEFVTWVPRAFRRTARPEVSGCIVVAVVQTVSPGRRDLIWCAGWCAVLAAGTGAAAVLLMSHNFAQRSQVVTDPQGHAEQLAAWRGAAILAYSSGSEVGHVCAVAYEVLAILGYVLGRTNHARAAFAAMFVLAITAPFSHIYATFFLINGALS
jgi:hypothetical protein